jgi:hypothetical protein
MGFFLIVTDRSLELAIIDTKTPLGSLNNLPFNGFNEVSWVNPLVQCSSLSQTGPARGIRGHKTRLSWQPSTKCMQWSNFFTNRVVNHWIALPAEVTDSQSINQFKNKYDAFKSSF